VSTRCTKFQWHKAVSRDARLTPGQRVVLGYLIHVVTGPRLGTFAIPQETLATMLGIGKTVVGESFVRAKKLGYLTLVAERKPGVGGNQGDTLRLSMPIDAPASSPESGDDSTESPTASSPESGHDSASRPRKSEESSPESGPDDPLLPAETRPPSVLKYPVLTKDSVLKESGALETVAAEAAPNLPAVATKAAPSTRGTRLPDQWMPSQAVIDQMRTACPYVNLGAEHDKFVDYWAGAAGAKGRKADWNATWRNWIRRAAEQSPTGRAIAVANNNGIGKPSIKAMGYADIAEQLAAEMENQ
jgi:hypothetical protein